MIGDIVGTCRTKSQLLQTRNYFDTLEAIAGKDLDVLERNDSGDCLCLVCGGSMGHYLIHVDNSDVESYKPR